MALDFTKVGQAGGWLNRTARGLVNWGSQGAAGSLRRGIPAAAQSAKPGAGFWANFMGGARQGYRRGANPMGAQMQDIMQNTFRNIGR